MSYGRNGVLVCTVVYDYENPEEGMEDLRNVLIRLFPESKSSLYARS